MLATVDSLLRRKSRNIMASALAFSPWYSHFALPWQFIHTLLARPGNESWMDLVRKQKCFGRRRFKGKGKGRGKGRIGCDVSISRNLCHTPMQCCGCLQHPWVLACYSQMLRQWSVSGLTVVNFFLGDVGDRQQMQAEGQEIREVTRCYLHLQSREASNCIPMYRFDNAA